MTRQEVINGIVRVDRETIKSLIDSAIKVIRFYLRRQSYIMNFMTKRNTRLTFLINDIDADRTSSNVEMQFNDFTDIASGFIGENEDTDKLVNYLNLLLYPQVKKYYSYNREFRETNKTIGNISIYSSDFNTIKTFLTQFKTDLG
jgi:hypothetical protein